MNSGARSGGKTCWNVSGLGGPAPHFYPLEIPVKDALTIIGLEIQNVKRLKAVSIKPDGSPTVIIGGQNGAGKTSVLDSIFYVLAGKSALCKKPVRDGESEATITADLGEYIVTRNILPDGKSVVKVVGKDGGRFNSPQTLLDSFVGNLSFDPMAFARMEPPKQLETLKRLVGLDFSAIDRQRASKVESRTLVNREVASFKSRLASMTRHEDAPTEEISVTALMAKLEEARQQNRLLQQHKDAMANIQENIEGWESQIDRLVKELAEAKEHLRNWMKKGHEMPDAPDAVDESAILAQISGSEASNRKYRENAERMKVAHQADQKAAASEELTKQIEALDDQKREALEAASFPVPGLSFDDGGVLVNGIPFQQASAAEQVRISVAMGLSLNPTLKVLLVRDASLLDEKSMELVAKMAAEHGGQVWLEKVGNGEECHVVIEDGMVVRRKGSC